MLKRLMRLAAQAVLPALVLIGAYAATERLLEGPARELGRKGPRPEVVYSVASTEIALGENRAVLRAFGEVVAADTAELRVASPGEVIAVHERLQVGQTVDARTPLVTIDPFAYEGALRDAKAQLAEARARAAEGDARIAMEESDLARLEEQLDLSRVDLDRAEQLARSGNITEKALDERRLIVSQRQQAFDQGRYTLEAERARREQNKAAIDRLIWTVEKAERAVADTVLRAPFKGIVRAENAAIGRLMQNNDVAVSLIKADTLDVRFVLSDQRYGRLLSAASLFGTSVSVIWRIGDTPISYDGTVYRAGADIEGNRGGVDVFAHLDLTGRAAPRPGAFVEVRIPGVVHTGTARVPMSALHDGRIFTIGEDRRLTARPVTVLALDGDEAIVRGDLTDGAAVVTTRLAEAGDGIKVRPINDDDTGGDGNEASLSTPNGFAKAPASLVAPKPAGQRDGERAAAKPQEPS
ncbi:MAG: HlyD family efflux transporter periplasmic adaptor subunit [Pseudomonadota bacterium]